MTYFLYLFQGAFRLYDLDNDGYITRDELRDIVDSIYKMVVSLPSFIVSYLTSSPSVYVWRTFYTSLMGGRLHLVAFAKLLVHFV